ncbi:MAG: aminodeoxychorismate/anthranilate synthase component II [Bacteroidota bacterium]
MRILVLDNYDSFTFNLVHILKELGYADQLEVHRNDKINLDYISSFDKILLSPGPGLPDEGGIMKDLVSEYAGSKSILGICLGHQAIAEVFGAKLFNMKEVLHGFKDEVIKTKDHKLFSGLPDQFSVARYHSWSVDPESINGSLEVIAKDKDGMIMGLTHTNYDVTGFQFHPESIITEYGKKILENWVEK